MSVVHEINDPTRQAAVYRLYDADGTLLYVGSSYDPDRRCRNHYGKPWWAHVARRVDQWHPSKETALAEESAAIAAESPAHNEVGTPRYVPPAKKADARLAGAELSVAQIVALHGVTRQTVHTYRRRGVFPQPVEGKGSTRPRFRADEVAVFFAANPKQPGRRTDRQTRPQQGEPAMTHAPTISDPVPASDRGFLIYGGREIPTDYGHTVRVQESSAAESPHVWLFVSDSQEVEGRSPHLDLEQAIAVHAALGQFIEGVANGWEGGAEMVVEATRRVLGTHEEQRDDG